MTNTLSLLTWMLMTTTALAAPSETDFATTLYTELAHGATKNLVFSPTSVRLALGVAYAGAHGETATQMRTVMGMPEGMAGHDAVKKQVDRWDALAHPAATGGSSDPSMQKYEEEELARRTTQLEIANRVWVQKGQTLKADYLALVAKDYRADATPLDIEHATEASRKAINAWVSERTKHKIPELITQGNLASSARVVITNTVYMKASWESPFQKSATAPGSFFASTTKAVNVPLMRQAEHYDSAQTADADLVELPYGDGKLSMVLVVPKAKDGLAALEKKVAELPKWLAALKSDGRIDLTLPKFKMAVPSELATALQNVGMKLAFTYPGADFSGIDGTKLLFIAKVIHQATIEVDEEGTVASAATAVSMRAGGMPQQPRVVRADRPFLFLIRDKQTNAILFIGRLVDPTVK